MRAHYQIIKNDISSIRASWEKFLQLFGSEESVELLNFFSGKCFGFFQKSLNDSIVLSILRLLDPHKQGKNNINLTIETLVIEYKDTRIDSKLQTIYSKLKEESEKDISLNATKLLVAIGTPESEIKENETSVNTLIPFTLKKYSAFLNATKN